MVEVEILKEINRVINANLNHRTAGRWKGRVECKRNNRVRINGIY